jgi:hypothetical protein
LLKNWQLSLSLNYTEIEMKINTSKEKVVITFNGKPFEVPPGGSLGVLALGNVGIKAWKKAKKAFEESEKNDKKEE